MITKIILKSGNIFYHYHFSNNLAWAIVISPNFTFLGGMLDEVANTKLETFKRLEGTQISVLDKIDFVWTKLNLIPFSEKLGSASKMFIDNFFMEVDDLTDFDGTSSKAESCDDRRDYYKACGCRNIYKTQKKFMVGMLIANHVSVFGVDNFKMTFFKGTEYTQKDETLYLEKLSYLAYNNVLSFKAPAPYLKALTSKF